VSSSTRGAVIVPEHRTLRRIAGATVEPLTLALAVSLAALGVVLGWNAHEATVRGAVPPVAAAAPVGHSRAPVAAEMYVEALCAGDTEYLWKNTGEEAGRMPWEPRLSDWARPCVRSRYLGSLMDRLGRDQFVFTLLRPDGTEVLYLVTIGHDGLIAGVD
jgi:hypothetical protein